jgi:cytochrome c553
MKKAFSALALAPALVALIAGCSSIERSRSLSNPNVPAQTIAQQVCSLCHGLDGNSVSPNFPRLAAQPSQYLMKQLQDFKSRDRFDPPGPQYMWGISRSLSDDQIKGLAEYFSSQKPAANAPGETKLVSEGEQIFKNGVSANNVPACNGCHGEAGQGNEQYPRLAGQHADYLIKQLHVFQNTDDRPAPLMKGVSHSLSEESIAAVANYVQGLAPR